jgi:hypothetical protein
MTKLSQDLCAAPPRVSPHAGTAVWPPDALVLGVSPTQEGLGMVEPSRSDPVKRLSNLTRTAPPLVGRREEPTLPYLPFVEILQMLLDRPSQYIERTLSTNLQDQAECHCWAGLAHRRDQGVELCHAHHEEPIKAYCLAGTIYRSNTEFPPVLRYAYS